MEDIDLKCHPTLVTYNVGELSLESVQGVSICLSVCIFVSRGTARTEASSTSICMCVYGSLQLQCLDTQTKKHEKRNFGPSMSQSRATTARKKPNRIHSSLELYANFTHKHTHTHVYMCVWRESGDEGGSSTSQNCKRPRRTTFNVNAGTEDKRSSLLSFAFKVLPYGRQKSKEKKNRLNYSKHNVDNTNI